MNVGLIITTYNWPEALVRVLNSIRQQSFLPSEVVVCDDGSKKDFKNYILELNKDFPCALKYVWQEDKGFRAAEIRNKGIKKLSKEIEYIIVIDGDMILHNNFIKDHLRIAEKNCFIQGGRVLISKNKTASLLKHQDLHISNKLNFFNNGLLNRKNSLYLPFLSKLFERPSRKLRGVRTCNMSFWRKDLYEVNGFNEDFIGWGREDTELVVRLFNNGIMRKNIRFAGLAFHLYHQEESRFRVSSNDSLLSKTIKLNSSWCDNGLIKLNKK